MCRAEGVVHVDVGQGRERLREAGVVLRLLAVEAEILEQQDLAVSQAPDGSLDLGTDAVARQLDPDLQGRGQGLRDGGEGELRVRGILGAAEVGGEDDAGPGCEEALERRKRGADAAIVADLVAFQGDVQVGADEYTLPAQLGRSEQCIERSDRQGARTPCMPGGRAAQCTRPPICSQVFDLTSVFCVLREASSGG